MGGGGLGRGQDPVQIWLRVTKRDIAGNRLVKHVVLLQNHSDIPAHVAVVQRLQIDVIEKDCALGRLEQAGYELDQSFLAAPAATYQRESSPVREFTLYVL